MRAAHAFTLAEGALALEVVSAYTEEGGEAIFGSSVTLAEGALALEVVSAYTEEGGEAIFGSSVTLAEGALALEAHLAYIEEGGKAVNGSTVSLAEDISARSAATARASNTVTLARTAVTCRFISARKNGCIIKRVYISSSNERKYVSR
ncbi:hypothetical protein FACS189449_07400 [Alphaproteobacteria bacterium]|nr:hypothetical protein FACS189449_07400 [Alphaproteobacteria bacterium]